MRKSGLVWHAKLFDMGQALYRKYRSRTLTEMVGQEHVTTALANSIANGRISHAYLFTGPRGVGKTSAARILAHEINGLPYGETQYLDIIEIDAASNRRIDDIRDLREKVNISPASAKYKVYIIDEVHMLTGESFNALLKTLEEPPAHVVFILATTEVHKLPATIVSRTQRFSFRLIDRPKVIAHLRSIADKENIQADDDALDLIAEYGEGSFRDSINLLDQLANVTGGKITAENVEKSLGLASKKAIEGLIKSILSKDFESTNKQLTQLENQGSNTASLVPQLTRYLQNLAVKHPELYELLDSLIEIPRSYNPRLKLRTTLVKFALPQSSARPAQPARSSSSASKPTPVATAKPVLNVEKPQPTPPISSAKVTDASQQAQGSKLDSLDNSQWGQILAKIKEESAPLYGIARQAQPDFDAASQTLTLKFRFALHQRRMEDAKNKKLVANIMLEVLGGAPIIQTVIDASTAAPDVEVAAPTSKPAAVDEVTKSVIDVMGGGEVVNA